MLAFLGWDSGLVWSDAPGVFLSVFDTDDLESRPTAQTDVEAKDALRLGVVGEGKELAVVYGISNLAAHNEAKRWLGAASGSVESRAG